MAGPEAAWIKPYPPPCEMGPTSGCRAGRHNLCSHGRGGACENGVVIRETVTMPLRRGGHTAHGVVAFIADPVHVYRCSCECHRGEVPAGMDGLQLDLFEGAT